MDQQQVQDAATVDLMVRYWNRIFNHGLPFEQPLLKPLPLRDQEERK